ncbi:hypothetical protein K523DRAFT_359039 [Schizophyllum commune Tattone D]|nr:hypothetical protein K523DRAFT_359039 [Schizophyllum commune Tattone D]
MELPKGACPTAENLPSQRDIRRYEASRNPDDGPRGQPKLLIDIGRTGPSTIWNLACVDVVYDELRRVEDTSLPPKADVQEAFHAYMQTLHTKYVRERDGTKPSRLKTNTKSRMRSAYERRLEGWRLHVHLPDARKHLDQWEELSADVVSPDRPTFVTDDEPAPHYDESKRQQFIYVSRRPHWRNPAEDPWFYVGSLLQWSTHFKKNGKARRGNYPAQRIRNHIEIDYSIPAPSNLPINFYDPGWLTESRRKALEPKPAFDTTLSVEIIRQAARYEHIRARGDLPLREDDQAIDQSGLFSQIGPDRIRAPAPPAMDEPTQPRRRRRH